MIPNFSPRLYQQTILATAASKNTLAVLPTGLGKTAIAFMLTYQRLQIHPNTKILMLAPTKPLCEQHLQTFQTYLPQYSSTLFTGSVAPKKRQLLFQENQIIISTPQGLENDIINKRITLQNIALLIIDEAHHATGDYAYVWVANQYHKHSKHERILALTASPGSDMDKIKEVCQNLHIERVEVRTPKDPDVKPYIQKVNFNYLEVDLPQEYKVVQKHLTDCRKSKLISAKNLGFCNQTDASKGQLLQMQIQLQKKLAKGLRDFNMLKSISLIAEALKVEHAIELLESQGITQCCEYLEKILQESLHSKVKATKNLVQDLNFKSSLHHAQQIKQKDIIHPKQIKLQEIIKEKIQTNPTTKIIIFTQFRDSAQRITSLLTSLNISNHIFVGQAKKKGLGFSQKEQKEILDKFRNQEFNVLVATSVAEEGLDIPKVDKVLFYEPVPSAIRAIQRRGRTGRLEEGEVTILLTKGTRDVIYRWASHHKEKRMYRNLETIKKECIIVNESKDQPLEKFIPKDQPVAIIADHREQNNRIVKELIDLGVSVKTQQLQSADYVISGTVGVELKKVPDFVASIIDQRLLDQIRDLKRNFPKSTLIIEGEQDIYAIRKIHPNAIRGMLSSIALDFQLPIIYTKNPQDTAQLLAVMAKREQDKTPTNFTPHALKPKSLKEQQEYLISSFPSLGTHTAKKILEHFHTIENLINANLDQLTKIDGVGPITAKRIKEICTTKYKNA